MNITELNGQPISSAEFVPVSAIWRPGGTGYIELAGIDPALAGQIMRGLLFGNQWFSLRSVCVSGRYGFDGLNQIPWQPCGTLYVQLYNGQTAMWHTPENDAALSHDRVLDYAGAMVYDGPIPLTLPDWSRTPWELQGRELLGYGMTNWLHIPNKRDFIHQMRDCIGPVPGRKIVFYADLFGSTATQTSNDPGYWMRHPEGVKDGMIAMACACREADTIFYPAFWSGNHKGPNGTGICDAIFTPGLYRAELITVRDTLGPAGIIVCPAGEPSHYDARDCQGVMHEIHALTYTLWPGWRIANWNEPTPGFLHELHTGLGKYGPPGTIDLTDEPSKLDWLTCGDVSTGIRPDRAAVLVGSDQDHGNATILYDMDPGAWRKDHTALWRAIGEAGRVKG